MPVLQLPRDRRNRALANAAPSPSHAPTPVAPRSPRERFTSCSGETRSFPAHSPGGHAGEQRASPRVWNRLRSVCESPAPADMKGKMPRVIYCVLSSLTVTLFETTVPWLHPGEGRARINGAGEEEIYGGTKPAAASAADAGSPPSSPPDVEQGKICSRGCTWIPSPLVRRCLLTYKLSLSRSSLERRSAVVALLSPAQPAVPCSSPQDRDNGFCPMVEGTRALTA